MLLISDPGHRSPFNIFYFINYCPAIDTIRPGRHRRVTWTTHSIAVDFGFYVCLPFNKFSVTPKRTYLRTQWRWRDLNPRPSPCKGAALPLSYIPRTCTLG